MDIKRIKEVFAENGVHLAADDAWQVQGTWVIKHKALERLSAAIKIVWDAPKILRAERDECVILVSASRPDKGVSEWSIGECAIAQPNGYGNYKVKAGGGQAAYPFAMGEKRGKDRVILKLAGLHGAYSEEEADDFISRSNAAVDVTPPPAKALPAPAAADRPKPAPAPAERPKPTLVTTNGEPTEVEKPAHVTETAPVEQAAPVSQETAVEEASSSGEPSTDDLKARLMKAIDDCDKIDKVADLMNHRKTNIFLSSLTAAEAEEMREYGKARLGALGWPNKTRRKTPQAA